ncbi:hypothetical protein LPJ56_003238, partial [Coemansia sp. RSA 2599]
HRKDSRRCLYAGRHVCHGVCPDAVPVESRAHPPARCRPLRRSQRSHRAGCRADQRHPDQLLSALCPCRV